MRLRTAFAAMIGGLLLGTTAIIGAAKAGVACYGEASAGKSLTATELGGTDVAVSAEGLLGGVGIGCDLSVGPAVIGILARYDLMDVDTAIATSDQMWSVAARAGVKINPGTLIYGLAGISGTELTFAGLETDPTGILLGAGLEIEIAQTNLKLFAEYNRIMWDETKVNGSTLLEPQSDVFRVGARYSFDLLK